MDYFFLSQFCFISNLAYTSIGCICHADQFNIYLWDPVEMAYFQQSVFKKEAVAANDKYFICCVETTLECC